MIFDKCGPEAGPEITTRWDYPTISIALIEGIHLRGYEPRLYQGRLRKHFPPLQKDKSFTTPPTITPRNSPSNLDVV